jgi:DnaJ-class molecular chaperone
MYSQNVYAILGIEKNASKDEIKKAYRDIAITCHPDKLHNISDENEKKTRIERFKEATVAYEKLMNGDEKDYEMFDWKNVFTTFFSDSDESRELFQDVLFDVANSFVQSNIYSKPYYNPQCATPTKYHKIDFHVTYKEIIENTKKKLRLVLIGLEEPIFVNIFCGSYPRVIKEFSDDNDDDHEIIINMKIKPHKNYMHSESKKGCIDLYTTYEINLLQYLQGCEIEIPYIDDTSIKVLIPAFQKEYIVIANKGINKGSLIIELSMKSIEGDMWNALSQKDKVDMLRILDIMYKMI